VYLFFVSRLENFPPILDPIMFQSSKSILTRELNQKLIPATKQVKTCDAIINLILFIVLFHLVNVEDLQTCAKKENASL
jgi:hypothetical protein